jgi:hypothetical protein
MENWILVLDDDKFSNEQMNVCKILKPKLAGVIMCQEQNTSHLDICNEVTFFPAFCNKENNACVYGVRETTKDFEDLLYLDNSTKPK